jgi:hypothetical protein
MIVGNPQGIVDEQLRPHPMHLLYIIILIGHIVIYYYIIKLLMNLILKNEDHSKFPTIARNGTLFWKINLFCRQNIRVKSTDNLSFLN